MFRKSLRTWFRTRLLAKLARRFGPRFVLPTIAAAEFADRNKYANQSDAHAISAEERGHAAVIQAVAPIRVAVAPRRGRRLPRAEPWHGQRQAITCGRPCSEPTTAWFRTFVWSWPLQAPVRQTKRSSSRDWQVWCRCVLHGPRRMALRHQCARAGTDANRQGSRGAGADTVGGRAMSSR